MRATTLLLVYHNYHFSDRLLGNFAVAHPVGQHRAGGIIRQGQIAQLIRPVFAGRADRVAIEAQPESLGRPRGQIGGRPRGAHYIAGRIGQRAVQTVP